MYMNKPVFTLCLFISCISTALAQTDFSGKVVEENRKPVKDAIVFLLGQNSVIEKTVMTDSLGRFQIREVDFNKEIVRVTAFGYENRDITSVSDTMVVMKPLGVNLQEVEVQAAARVEQKNDRFVFSVANTSLAKASSSSFELLKMAPMIEDKNNRLSILGKESAELYINGRKSNLTQEAMRAYLQSLPADRIANIEVITNPGVTNSIDANKGIINLVLKKNEADGVKGSFNFEDSQKYYNSQNGGLFLDVQKGNFNMTVNAYGENNRGKTSSKTDYYYFESKKHDYGNNEIKNQNISGGGNIRMDYHLNQNHTIGAVVDYYHNDNTDKTDNQTKFFSTLSGNELDSLYNSWTKDNELTNRVSANINYRAKLSEQDNLSVDFDYFWNKKEHTVFNDFNREDIQFNQQFNERSEEIFNNYSGKVEYSHRFNDAHNFIAGVEFSRTDQDADFSHTDIFEGVQTPDLSKNNHFDYNETLTKGYLAWNWRFGNKWMGNAGVRLENSKIEGVQQATGETIDRKDFDIAPNLSVMFIPNSNNSFNYNFMTVIGRPGFYSLNPFRFYINPNTYKEYNSSLEVSKLYIQSLSYSLMNRYIFGLDYTYGNNVTNNFYIPVDDKYTKMINANFGDTHLVMLRFVWNQDFFNKRLFINTSAMGFYQRSKGCVESVIIDTEGVFGTFSVNGNAILSSKYNWSLSFSGYYRTVTKGAPHEDTSDAYMGNLSFQKVFPRDIKLSVGGFFMKPNYKTEKAYSNYQYYTKTNFHECGVFVKLTIPFGNTKTKGAQGRNTTSSSSRLKE